MPRWCIPRYLVSDRTEAGTFQVYYWDGILETEGDKEGWEPQQEDSSTLVAVRTEPVDR